MQAFRDLLKRYYNTSSPPAHTSPPSWAQVRDDVSRRHPGTYVGMAYLVQRDGGGANPSTQRAPHASAKQRVPPSLFASEGSGDGSGGRRAERAVSGANRDQVSKFVLLSPDGKVAWEYSKVGGSQGMGRTGGRE